jgi:hypothetical protein
MSKNDFVSIIDYKNLYYDIKNKYDKITMELEELKIDNKLKEEEINLLRRKLSLNSNLIRINYLEKKDSSSVNGDDNANNDNFNSAFKQINKKYDSYSIDSFRNEPEQGNDLLQELMKSEIDDMKLQKLKNTLKIEKFNIQILSTKFDKFIINENEINNIDNNNITNKINDIKKIKNINKNINKTLTGDIDAILLNIKKKQEYLHETQKMFNLENDK